MTESKKFFPNIEDKKKSDGCNLTSKPSDKYSLIFATFKKRKSVLITEILTDFEKHYKHIVINPSSRKTYYEEIKAGGGIGGHLPTDNTPAYESAVRAFRHICKYGRGKTFLTSTDNADIFWLHYGCYNVQMSLKGVILCLIRILKSHAQERQKNLR